MLHNGLRPLKASNQPELVSPHITAHYSVDLPSQTSPALLGSQLHYLHSTLLTCFWEQTQREPIWVSKI